MTKLWNDIYGGLVANILSRAMTEEQAEAEASDAETRASNAAALDTADGDAAMVLATVERDAWTYKAILVRHQREPTPTTSLMVRLFAGSVGLTAA